MEPAMTAADQLSVDSPLVLLSTPSPSSAIARKDYWLLAATKLRNEEPKLADALDGTSKVAVVDSEDIADNAVAATIRNRGHLVEKRWQIHFRSKTTKHKD